MTYVLFITSCLTPCYGRLIPFKQDENIWVYLAKIVLNISNFCFAGGTYVEQTCTTCLMVFVLPWKAFEIVPCYSISIGKEPTLMFIIGNLW